MFENSLYRVQRDEKLTQSGDYLEEVRPKSRQSVGPKRIVGNNLANLSADNADDSEVQTKRKNSMLQKVL